MRQAQKLKCLAAVLFLGVVGSLPFQHTRPLRTRGQPSERKAGLPVRHTPVVLSVPNASKTRIVKSPASMQPAASRSHVASVSREPAAPPSLESSYRSLAPQRGQGKRAWRILKDPAGNQAENRALPEKEVAHERVGAAPREENLEEEPIAWKMHRLRDGDTLPHLARRYLKNERFAALILALNQDRISAAELLPLGVEIRIPPPNATDALLAKLRAAAPRSPSNESEPKAGRLVPVPAVTLQRVDPATP